ncbi:DUF2793 domain-containing protein [Pararhizobium sp.]|uniref:DUF2793 domain-containing protein n=1 Tax=Pararhizobium sp. TaxID=1977563 RepID=UPI003D13C17F
MTDSVQVFDPTAFVPDSNGDPVSGAKIYVYDAGTTDLQTVYSDEGLTTALPNPIICNSAGKPVTASNALTDVYVGTAAYKVRIDDANDVNLHEIDNRKAALNTSSFSTGGSGTYSRPRISKAADYSIVAADAGDIIIANPTGGTFTLTLPSAVTVGDGFTVGIRHDGTANQVRIAPVSSQTIDVPGANAANGYALRSMGHYIEIGSDGANWGIVDETLPLGEQSPITVVDILSSPPASPNAGDIYMLDASPTGDWSAQSQHDLAQSDGQGGWIFYTPPTNCGWEAYDQDSSAKYRFEASAWVLLDDKPPTASTRDRMVVRHTETTGTSASAGTATAWTARKLDDEDVNTITGASLSSNQITLPTGTYSVSAWQTFDSAADVATRFISTTDSAKLIQGGNASMVNAQAVGGVVPLEGIITVSAASETFEYQYHVDIASGGALGKAQNISGTTEVYAVVVIVDLAAQQGPEGNPGTQGPTALTVSTVAGLNALSPSEGQLGYASDGRKNGEGAAAGTGVQCFYDGSAWIAVDTGATVAA